MLFNKISLFLNQISWPKFCFPANQCQETKQLSRHSIPILYTIIEKTTLVFSYILGLKLKFHVGNTLGCPIWPAVKIKPDSRWMRKYKNGLLKLILVSVCRFLRDDSFTCESRVSATTEQVFWTFLKKFSSKKRGLFTYSFRILKPKFQSNSTTWNWWKRMHFALWTECKRRATVCCCRWNSVEGWKSKRFPAVWGRAPTPTGWLQPKIGGSSLAFLAEVENPIPRRSSLWIIWFVAWLIRRFRLALATISWPYYSKKYWKNFGVCGLAKNFTIWNYQKYLNKFRWSCWCNEKI